MADNTVLSVGAGGDTIATDDIAGVKHQRIKVQFGADGSATDVSAAAPLPVDGSGVTQPISHGALTELAAAINASSQVDVNIAASAATVAVSNGGLTELAAAINASSQVDVNIAASGATVPVSHAALTELAAAINASSQLDVNVVAGGVSGVIEDAPAAGGEEGVMVLAVRRDVASSGVSLDGDFAALSVTSDGSLRVSGGGGGTEYVVDAVAPAAPTGATFVMERDDALSALTEIEGDWTNPRASANGALWVAVDGTVTVGSHAVTNAGTFAVQAASAGIAADDAATSGNPVLVAGVAVETDGTDPTTVSAEGDAAYLRTDRARRLLVSEHHPRSFFTSADYAAAQTNTSVQAAPGVGLSLYITDIVISNGATAGNITLLDGSGGTVKFELYPAINGGCAISLRQPIRLTANTALVITSTTVTTHSVSIGGYTAP